tara:strand:+ start:1460 stop:2203 length:744 start_codon:yes stop_codon:yes gene_type:complete
VIKDLDTIGDVKRRWLWRGVGIGLLGAFAAAVAYNKLPSIDEVFAGEHEPIHQRDPITSEARQTFRQMKDVLKCYKGPLAVTAITDHETIKEPAGADEKPITVDQAQWDYYQKKMRNMRQVGSTILYDRSGFDEGPLEQVTAKKVLELKENPSVVFYVVATADGTYDEDKVGTDKAPKYADLKQTLLRANSVTHYLVDLGINPERICRVPKGRVSAVGLSDPSARAAKIYAFDSGIENHQPTPVTPQ